MQPKGLITMNKENCVMFKGTKDGLIILLDAETSFADIKETFKEKVKGAQTFLNGAKVSVTFKGRELSDTEESELLGIISHKSNLSISFIQDEAKTHFSGSPLPSSIDLANHMTNFINSSVRSGSLIKAEGSVVVIGDVNPGGEVVAGGNIIVLGTAKGLVHAGYPANKDAFIVALNLNPTQIRIADIITRLPENYEKTTKAPEFCYIQNNQICISPLTND